MPNKIILNKKIQNFSKKISIPGDKSISIRWVLISSLANGISKAKNLLISEDVLASIKAIIKGLKPGQQKTMRKHARHHSLKHMRSMALAMKKGATFQTAHRKAMRSVGK